MNPLIDCIAIFILIFINGFFAFAEFSLISARKTVLRQKVGRGDRNAAAALAMAENPTNFLSAIQIGVTLVGTLIGAIGVITLASPLAGYLETIPFLAAHSTAVSIAIIVIVTTYFTLVFGELVPKRIALSNAEYYASAIARPMNIFADITSPFVLVLSYSTEFILMILGIKKTTETPVTDDEIRLLIEQGTRTGEFEAAEADLVAGVFNLNDLRIENLMTRRLDIIGLDLNDPPEKNWKKVEESGRSYFPVYRDTVDNLAGIVSVKDLWSELVHKRPPDLAAVLQKPYYVPESISMLRLLDSFRQSKKHIAIVVDEYGSVQGIITMSDILKVIVGYQPLFNEPEEEPVIRREDGSWLVKGSLPIPDFKDLVDNGFLPGEVDGYFHTVAGFVMTCLQRVPVTGDSFVVGRLKFEVVNMEGKRVARVLVTRLPDDPQEKPGNMPV
jgi:putative hemolysin